ncbi:putative membrane protein [Babesia divergens]|uniref:Membrane protein n=1 Tax=Babesia divergens TaxID=32595 RepID=A0AAD9GHK4_BABDI|nr:putative membrane protein [Babesia divergens]
MALCLLIALILSKYTVEAFKGDGRGNAVLENMKNGAKDQNDHLSVNTAGVTQNSAKSDSHKKHVAKVTTERNVPHSSGTQGTGAGNSTSKKGGLRGAPSDGGKDTVNSRGRMTAIFMDAGYFNTLVIILGLLVCVISLVSNVKMKIDSNDEFVREAFDACVKQISLMSLVILGFYIVIHTDIARTLDSLITKEPKHLEVLDAILQISFFVFCYFIIFCAFLACVVSRIVKFMRKSDEADVLTTAKEYDFVNGSILGFVHEVMDKTKYLMTRMEFVDEIKQRGFQENNATHCYDYMVASLLKISTGFLKISRSSLFIAFTVVLVLRLVGEVQIFTVISVLTALNACAIALLSLRLFYLESQLYSPEPSQYLLMKLNVGNVGEELQPIYKGLPEQYVPSNFVQRWMCGYGATNAHENLFWLKQNGPVVMHKLFEALIFCHLILISVWSYNLKGEPLLVFEGYSDVIPIPATILIMYLLPKILYSLMVVTKCGAMIDFELLEKVLISSKNENSKNSVQLIDALAIEAAKFALQKGGDNHWKILLAKQKTLSDSITRELVTQWEFMKGSDDKIGRNHLIKYIQSQLSITRIFNNQQLMDFIKLFMRHDAEKANFEEFMVFGYVIGSVILDPLEENSIIELFENKFNIPWKSPCGIHLNNFDTIVKSVCSTKLNLKWNVNSQRHFLGFIGGGAVEGMSPEYLVQQLEHFQQACHKQYFSNL